MRLARYWLWMSICCMLAVVPELAQTPPPELSTFFRNQLKFTQTEVVALESGKTVVKLPDTPEAREVAAVAVARLDVPVQFFIERVRNIVDFKKSERVLQIGKFSNPPRLSDLSELTVDQVDIDTLKACRIKACGFKMSAMFIERFRNEIDWTAPNYRDKATELAREMLLDHVQNYLKSGNAALGKYDDKSNSLTLADELRPLLKSAPYMFGYTSQFQKYLEEFPHASVSNAAVLEDFLYWSKEDFGLKPVTSVTHVTIYRPSLDRASGVIVSSKGIYGSHYFDSSIGVTTLVHSQAPNPRSYLIYVNRSRADALGGLFGGWKRSLIGGRIRDGARKSMDATKQRLETEYAKTD